MGAPLFLFMMAIYALQQGAYLFAAIALAAIIPSLFWKARC